MSHLRRPQAGHVDPQRHIVSSQIWGRGDATSPNDIDPELVENRRKRAQNARELQTQIQQNKERREREKQNEERRREKEEADLINYQPFGRGGAGAPLRNEFGDIQANLREVTREAPNPSGSKYDGAAPAIHDLLERTRPGVGGPPPSYAPPRRRPAAHDTAERVRGRAAARAAAALADAAAGHRLDVRRRPAHVREAAPREEM